MALKNYNFKIKLNDETIIDKNVRSFSSTQLRQDINKKYKGQIKEFISLDRLYDNDKK